MTKEWNSDDVLVDVKKAVIREVFNIKQYEEEIFENYKDIVPSKPPPHGRGADRAAWVTKINKIEGHLHCLSPDYQPLDLMPSDADATLHRSIAGICEYIRDKILALPL